MTIFKLLYKLFLLVINEVSKLTIIKVEMQNKIILYFGKRSGNKK